MTSLETLTRATFNTNFYLRQNPDVAAALVDPASGLKSAFDHFVWFGEAEGRSPSPFFDTQTYLTENPDVAAYLSSGNAPKGYSAFEHFATFGQFEERDPSLLFDTDYYLAENPDVAAYLYSGNAPSGFSAFDHFVQFGRFEGADRAPSETFASFNPASYYAANADLQAAFGPDGAGLSGEALDDALFAHFLQFGFLENRLGTGTSFGPAPAPANPTPPPSPSVPPASPSLILAADSDTGIYTTDRVTADNTPTFEGTAKAGVRVELVGGADGNTVLGSTQALADGSWTITSAILSDGVQSVRARATDVPGSTSALSDPVVLTVDTQPPSRPTAVLAADSDTGSSATDGITSDNTPTFAGTAEAGATVKLVDGSGNMLLGSAVADTNGRWTITSASLTDGQQSLRVGVTDIAGNKSALSDLLDLTIDTTQPSTTISAIGLSADTGASSSDYITGAAVQTLSVTSTTPLEDGEIVQVSLDAGATWQDTTATSSPTSFIFNATLQVGNGIVLTRVVDAAGNEGAEFSRSYVLDTSAPVTPGGPRLAVTSDTGISAIDGITRVTQPTFVGSNAEPGSRVILSLQDGQTTTTLGAADADGFGGWVITVASPLPQGTHTLQVHALDAAGNASGVSTATTITIDTDVPATPTAALTSASDTGTSATDRITADNTPSYTGQAEPGSIVYLFDPAANRTLGSAQADAAGGWSITSATLTDGVYNLSAWSEDIAGNRSISVALPTLTVDKTPPAAPSLSLVQDTGISDHDLVTSLGQVAIDGLEITAGTVYEYAVDDSLSWITAGSTQGSATGRLDFTGLNDGTHTIAVRQIDIAGNISQTGTITFTLDRSGDETFVATAQAERFDGGPSTPSSHNLVSYASSTVAVTINLNYTDGTGTFGGYAEGDRLVNIQDLTGSSFDDTFIASAAANRFDGGQSTSASHNRVSYEASNAGVIVSLNNTNGVGTSGGYATGDVLLNIQDLTGSAYDDIFIASAAANNFNGGTGSNTVNYASSAAGVTVNLSPSTGTGNGGHATQDTFVNIQNVIGSAYTDTLIGYATVGTRSVLSGGAGGDTLIGVAANRANTYATYAESTAGVTIYLPRSDGFGTSGGDAAGDRLSFVDNLIGSAFNDTFFSNAEANRFDGGAGTDTVSYAASNAAVRVNLSVSDGSGNSGGYAAADRLVSIENLVGSSYNDTLKGVAEGGSVLTGGVGADVLIGVGNGNFTSYAGSSAAVMVDLKGGTGIGGHAQGDALQNIHNIIGSTFNDTFYASAQSNTFVGGGGDGDTVSYQYATGSNLTASLASGSGTSGEAAGDTFSGISNLTGSAIVDSALSGNNRGNVLTALGESTSNTLNGNGAGTGQVDVFNVQYGGANQVTVGTGDAIINVSANGSDTIVNRATGTDNLVSLTSSSATAVLRFEDLGATLDFSKFSAKVTGIATIDISSGSNLSVSVSSVDIQQMGIDNILNIKLDANDQIDVEDSEFYSILGSDYVFYDDSSLSMEIARIHLIGV